MNKKALKTFALASVSISSSVLRRIAGLPRLASFGIHVLLLAWIIFYSPGRWAYINWYHVIPCLVLGFLAFKRSS